MTASAARYSIDVRAELCEAADFAEMVEEGGVPICPIGAILGSGREGVVLSDNDWSIMTIAEEMKVRISHLIQFGFRQDYILLLLLTLRDNSFGLPLVREVGDFVAHRHEREKGAATDDLRLGGLNILHSAIHKVQGIRLEPTSMPHYTFWLATRNVARLPAFQVKNALGVSKKAALQTILSIEKDTKAKGSQKTIDLTNIDQYRMNILYYAFYNFTVAPFASADKFWMEFCEALQKNKFIEKKNLSLLNKIKIPVILCVATILHGTLVRLTDQHKILLMIREHNGKIGVFATLPVQRKDLSLIFVDTWFMTTDLNASDVAEDFNLNSGSDYWKRIYDVSSSGKLKILC